MTVRTRSLVAGFGLALLAAGVLTACATPAGSGSNSTPSSSSSTGDDAEISAAWLDGGSMIGLVTFGSSTCVPTAGEPSYSNGVLEVELSPAEDDAACTRDYVPVVTLVAVPEDVDPSKELEIKVTGSVTGDTDLDGVAEFPTAQCRLDRRGRPDRDPHVGLVDVRAGGRERHGDRSVRGDRDVRHPARRPGLHDGHGGTGHGRRRPRHRGVLRRRRDPHRRRFRERERADRRQRLTRWIPDASPRGIRSPLSLRGTPAL